jgi:hypothetical protein
VLFTSLCAVVTGGEGTFTCVGKGTPVKDGSGALFGTYKFDLDLEAAPGCTCAPTRRTPALQHGADRLSAARCSR